MKIIAIGGGSLGLGETEPMDRELISLANKENPLALFIPTASGDDELYIREFELTYDRYGCRTEVLRLHSDDNPSKIAEADVIYVGGGNTKMMLELWRETGTDAALTQHLKAGKPAGGLSAGALCWFRVGNSDWPQYEGIPGVNTDRLDCMGLVDLVLCPHASREPFRLDEFRTMMKGERGAGMALDDGCAIQIEADSYRIMSSLPGAVAHHIEWRDSLMFERELPPHEYFRPLASLHRVEVHP